MSSIQVAYNHIYKIRLANGKIIIIIRHADHISICPRFWHADCVSVSGGDKIDNFPIPTSGQVDECTYI